ncbi:MAG: hypothetical protein GEU83_07965 [Pseudonocardiaceae bacterium]|nr:hypothetical protein [Pseudonocardiaceae bacterium]
MTTKSVTASEAAPPSMTGQLVIFEHELAPLTSFNDPNRCNNAPPLAHLIVNLTDDDIVLYADDRCAVPLVTVKPGYGSHVAPGQSFSAG